MRWFKIDIMGEIAYMRINDDATVDYLAIDGTLLKGLSGTIKCIDNDVAPLQGAAPPELKGADPIIRWFIVSILKQTSYMFINVIDATMGYYTLAGDIIKDIQGTIYCIDNDVDVPVWYHA